MPGSKSMPEEKNDKPKIIIDEDWKTQARREKEQAAAKQAAEQKEKAGRQFPPGDFAALVSMLATQTLFALGLIAQNENEKPEPDLPLAKFHIDMLASLEDKTKGNLTEQEKTMLTGTLSQLRMAFVQAAG